MTIIKQLAYGAFVVIPVVGFASIHATDVNVGASPPHAAVVVNPRAHSDTVSPSRFRRGVTRQEMDARIMSFDRDHSGSVTKDELPERMQALMSHDINHDRMLSPSEIALQSKDLRAPTLARGFGGSVYGFDDESEDASRAHIDGALADLRLPRRSYKRASVIVEAFLDERVRRASLQPQPQPNATEPHLVVVRSVNGQRIRVLTAFRSTPRMPRLDPAERSQLAANLVGVLSDEQCDDFLAAIARRPIGKVDAGKNRTAANGAIVFQTNAIVVANAQ